MRSIFSNLPPAESFTIEPEPLTRIFHAYCDFGSGRGTSDEIAGSVSNECQNEFIF